MNKMQTLLTTIVLLFGINSTGFTSSNDRLENLFKENIVKAKQGDADAQLNLGVMYANGEGVLKDLSKAKYWIKKAYENPGVSASTLGLAEKGWNQLELWKY